MSTVRIFLFLAATIVACFCSVLAAERQEKRQTVQAPAKAGLSQGVQEIEEVKAVEAQAKPGFAEFAGRLHPVVIHFPIAWLSLLFLADVFAWFYGRKEASAAGGMLPAIVLLSFAPAMISGFILASYQGDNPELRALLVPHRNLNVAAGILFLLAFLTRTRWLRIPPRAVRATYFALLTISLGLLILGSHFGGKMVHGRDFLPF